MPPLAAGSSRRVRLGRPAGRRLIVIVVLLALVAGLAVVVAGQLRPSPLSKAEHLVGQDSRFSNGPRAGAAFADVSRIMLADASSCARHRSAADRRCAARYSAAAFTSVSAFVLVGCTQPNVYQARRALLAQLHGIATVDRRHGVAQPPAVPPVPVC
jgi:hypothetical protein